MITYLLFDFARVLAFPKETGISSMAQYYRQQTSSNTDIFDYISLNTELLDAVKNSKLKYENRAIISNSGEILKNKNMLTVLQPIFSNIWLAKNFEWGKDQAGLYLYLSEKMAIKTENILFIDDSFANISAAKNAGCKTHQYQANQTLYNNFPELFSK